MPLPRRYYSISRMTRYILHGGFTRKENDLNRSFFREFVKHIPDGGTALMVFFASREEDPTSTFKELSERVRAEAGSKKLNFVLASREGFLDEMRDADAVYINGGSTNKLLAILRTYPDLAPLMQDKTVAGSSAGAYALVRYGTSHSEESVREGLGLLPLRVVCHYESPELPPSQASLEALKSMAQNLELVLLKDCEWKTVNETDNS